MRMQLCTFAVCAEKKTRASFGLMVEEICFALHAAPDVAFVLAGRVGKEVW